MPHNQQATVDQDFEIPNLEPEYFFRDREAVVVFLQENTFLIDLLKEAAGKIREYFGASAQLAIEVFSDQDDPGENELFVRIRTELNPSIARKNLTCFDKDWWLEASHRSNYKLNIALE